MGKKFPTKYIILTIPKVGPKKCVLIVVSRNAVILDVKIAWFGCQVAVGIKMQFLGVVNLPLLIDLP